LHYRWHDRTGTYTDTGGTVRSYRPYSVVDSRLSWNADNYSFYIEANNLTAHRYVDYGNVPQPGFWLTVGARYRL
jgi:iron complex outermembrane receptor protein